LVVREDALCLLVLRLLWACVMVIGAALVVGEVVVD
jgi:hypothetical protein